MSSQIDDIIKNTSHDLSAQFSKTWKTIEADLINIIKSSHLKSLKEQNASTVRTKFYENLKYRLHDEIEGSFILPDVITVFMTSNGIKPFTSKGDVVESIIFPLTSSQLLIGERVETLNRPLKQWNRILASAAFGSFIAKSDSPNFRSLACRIGRNADLLSDADINETKRAFITELMVGSSKSK